MFMGTIIGDKSGNMHTEAVFENIAVRIESEINKAEKSVIIAVAWFTNLNLFNVLLKKAGTGCQVSVMITDDEINNNSAIDFNRLNTQYSTVHKIVSTDKNLMHNKFCIIDCSTVITGSYNWSYKAENNHENIVINYGDLALAKQFVNEFHYIKSLYFPEESSKEPKQNLPLDNIIKRLEVLKNFIVLEDFEDISHTTRKLKKFEEHPAIQEIVALTEKNLFGEVIEKIQEFISQYQQLTVWNDLEIDGLKLEIRMLENQINAFENEKADVEKTINDFQHRHTRELGELILAILKLRKLKFKNDTEKAKEAEEDYDQYQQQYETEIEKEVFELDEVQQTELKKQFRSASILCHPDKFINEPPEIQKLAEELFKELNEANSKNDLRRVSEMLQNLKNGVLRLDTSSKTTDKERLKQTIARLKQKLQRLEQELDAIKNSEAYIQLSGIKDWDSYFEQNKELLQKELEELQHG
jgi:curved DNA-binding protein CbpA